MIASYGTIPAVPRALARNNRHAVSKGLLFASMAAILASVLLLAGVAQHFSPGQSTILIHHGSVDPGNLDWDGCGAGGNCGATYHWDSESYSPFSGESIRMSFTHDHTSFANWFNETEGTWVKGAHLFSPYTKTRNATRYNYSVWMPLNMSELEPPMEFFGKMFPKERGYSCFLFGNCSKEKEAAEEEEEVAAAAEEEPAAEAAEEEEPPPPHPLAGYGSTNPRVFGDLAPIRFVFPHPPPRGAAPPAPAAEAAADAEAEGEGGAAAPAEVTEMNATFVHAPGPLVHQRIVRG